MQGSGQLFQKAGLTVVLFLVICAFLAAAQIGGATALLLVLPAGAAVGSAEYHNRHTGDM